VPETIPAAAVRAAVTVSARLGVACTEPTVLADGANVIIHLRPAPVVAKVPASTPAVRPDPAARLQRELDVAAFLIGAGIPVMPPASELPATVQHGEGQVMSFWQYLEPSGGGVPDEGTIGSMLRDLHATLCGYPDALPVLAPLGDIPAFLGRSETMLCSADIAMLGDAYTRLTAELAPASAPGQVLHGDAGAGNLMATGGRWVWHDLEDACAGPVEWDLAATTASPRFDRSRILAAYGGTIDPAQLRVCEDLRRLHLTIWYALYAERLPECRRRASDLLSAWRSSSSVC
jgi:hypothetical protein